MENKDQQELTDIWSSERTSYTITDEHEERSTITLEKWAADYLQELLPDVHAWVQKKYLLICEKKPELSCREKGNFLRKVAREKAKDHPKYVSIADIL